MTTRTGMRRFMKSSSRAKSFCQQAASLEREGEAGKRQAGCGVVESDKMQHLFWSDSMKNIGWDCCSWAPSDHFTVEEIPERSEVVPTKYFSVVYF